MIIERDDCNVSSWIVEIGFENKKIRVGAFKEFKDAVVARKEAELKYFGFNKE